MPFRDKIVFQAVQLESVNASGEVTFGGNVPWLDKAIFGPVGDVGSMWPAMSDDVEVDSMEIGTLGRNQRAYAGDWIIRNAAGELFAVSADAFEQKYLPVEGEPGSYTMIGA